MKTSTLFTCRNCAYQASKWVGLCPQCDEWNTFEEEVVNKKTKKAAATLKSHAREPESFDAVLNSVALDMRTKTHISELDTVLGGGVVAGSVMLLTGEPGIGKSTLTLQIAQSMSRVGKQVLYVSGEESQQQIALRGKRLGLELKNLRLLSETNLETVIASAEQHGCDFLIIDSIQVMASEVIPAQQGSVSQVRLCTEVLMEYAKPRQMPVLIIGHVTKDGTLAGPRVLEHLVDTVLYLEGDRTHEHRMLRASKNRYGSAQEVGIFQMTETGLNEVSDATRYFISERPSHGIGSALTVTMEGNRPLLLEVQALVSQTSFGYPRRTANGFDVNRLHMLIAVLQKYTKVNLSNHDVFVNVVSGYKLHDPQADLAVCAALISSFQKKSLADDVVYVGEVGLSGEIRGKGKNRKQLESLLKKTGIRLSPIAKHITEATL